MATDEIKSKTMDRSSVLSQLDPAEDAIVRTAPTPEEVLSAIKTIKPGTAPKLDGLPIEFYIPF